MTSTMGLPGWVERELAADPIRMVDVGARGGWQPKWREADAHTLFVGVEPDRAEYDRLVAAARPNERFLDACLYHSDAEVTLYHCDPPTCTSIYRPSARTMARLFGARRGMRVVREETIRVTTLDRALSAISVGTIDCIKLDTQGSELDILRGSRQTLAGPLLAVEVEVEFTHLYEDQPLFHDIAGFLHRQGFELVDIPRQYSTGWIRFGHRGMTGYASVRELAANWFSLLRPGGGLRGGHRLVYADAVFLRAPSAWIEEVLHVGARARSTGLRGFVTCCVLGYDDYARELGELLRAKGLLDDREVDDLSRWITRRSRSWRRARRDAGHLARRVVHRLQHLGDL